MGALRFLCRSFRRVSVLSSNQNGTSSNPRWSCSTTALPAGWTDSPGLTSSPPRPAGWFVWAGTARWPSCATPWCSEPSWTPTLRCGPSSPFCRWESYLRVRPVAQCHRAGRGAQAVLSLSETICLLLSPVSSGSTDVVSCSVHGVRDPVTAALHIILGNCDCGRTENEIGFIMSRHFIRWPIGGNSRVQILHYCTLVDF